MEGCKVSNGEVGEASVGKVGGKIPPVLKIPAVLQEYYYREL